MSINPTNQETRIRLFKEVFVDQYCFRPHKIQEDSSELHDTIGRVARAVLSETEYAAAKLTLEMRSPQGASITPLMQTIFLQFEKIRNEFPLIKINTLDLFQTSLFIKLFDQKFISKKGKDFIIQSGDSSAITCEDFVRNMAECFSITLHNISQYFLQNDTSSLKLAQKDIKRILVEFDDMDHFLHDDEEDLLQKSWGLQIKTFISLLDQCIQEMHLLPLLVQVPNPTPIGLDQIFSPSFIIKQKELLQTFASCIEMYLERQERRLSQHKGKCDLIRNSLSKKLKELKNKILPQISLMISLLEKTEWNLIQKIFNLKINELENLLDLFLKIDKCRDELTNNFVSFLKTFSRTEFPGTDSDSPHVSLGTLIIPIGNFVIYSMVEFRNAIFSRIHSLYTIQFRIEKCLSLCTAYPIRHSLVSKLDLFQTTSLLLINDLEEVPEIKDVLLQSHLTCFMRIRNFLLLKEAPHHAFDDIVISFKKHSEHLKTLPREKSSSLKALTKEFLHIFNEVTYPELLHVLLTASGTQTLFKKTDFHFLRARLNESLKIILIAPFDLESIPDPQILSKLKSINETLKRFYPKIAEITLGKKYSEIQQLDSLALELFNIREDLEEINNFYNSFNTFFQNQVNPEKWMNDVQERAYQNFLLLKLFDQGNKAFFAYCQEAYLDSITPPKQSRETSAKKVAASRAPLTIEEITTENVAAPAPEIKRVKDNKRNLKSLCMKLKHYSLPKSEINADFILGHDAIQNIQSYILQIENLFCTFEEFPYQSAKALFSKLSNLIEQAGNFVAAAKNVQGAINHKHDLIDDLRALGITITPIVHVLNGWSSTKYHYSESGLSTETLSMLEGIKSSSIRTLTAKKTLEGMMHEAYAFTSGLLNSVAHVELQDSLYEAPQITILLEAIMPSLTIDPLLDDVNTLVTRTQMSFSADRTAYIAQVSDNEDFDDKRMRMRLVSSGCRIIKEVLSNLSDLAKPVSSRISYTIAESLLLNAALALERAGFITLTRLNIVGKDNRHIVFSKPEYVQDSRELRFNHDLEKIFGVMNLEIIEARKDIITFFGNTVGGATRYLTQYKMGAATLLEEILFLNVIRKELQEGGLFKEEEHRRLKELFGSTESATPENVDIKLSQLMDIVNDKVARALELTAALLRHNLT